jgi:hypothetical protein
MLQRVLNNRVSGVVWVCACITFILGSLFGTGTSSFSWPKLIVLVCICGAGILPAIMLLRGDPLAVWVVRVEAAVVLLYFAWWAWRRNWFIDLATSLAIGVSVWVLVGLSYKHHEHTS